MHVRSTHRPLSKRILVISLGMALSVLGLIGLFLPLLPGLLLLFPGLALLGGEFVWARRLLEGVRSTITPRSRQAEEDRHAA